MITPFAVLVHVLVHSNLRESIFRPALSEKMKKTIVQEFSFWPLLIHTARSAIAPYLGNYRKT